MLFRATPTPGPGGFSPGFINPQISPVPAQAHPVPGVYSGPSTTIPEPQPGLWIALIVLVVLVIALTIVVSRGGGRSGRGRG